LKTFLEKFILIDFLVARNQERSNTSWKFYHNENELEIITFTCFALI